MMRNIVAQVCTVFCLDEFEQEICFDEMIESICKIQFNKPKHFAVRETSELNKRQDHDTCA